MNWVSQIMPGLIDMLDYTKSMAAKHPALNDSALKLQPKVLIFRKSIHFHLGLLVACSVRVQPIAQQLDGMFVPHRMWRIQY